MKCETKKWADVLSCRCAMPWNGFLAECRLASTLNRFKQCEFGRLVANNMFAIRIFFHCKHSFWIIGRNIVETELYFVNIGYGFALIFVSFLIECPLRSALDSLRSLHSSASQDFI